MVDRKEKPWIDVYPLNTEVDIINSGARVKLSPELSDYCEKLWQPKAEKKWTSSWIAFAEKLKDNYFKVMDPYGGGLFKFEISAGAMPFKYVDGINSAIEEKKPFAPEQGYINCLSVGFPTATEDGKVIFQRRASDVHCPNILIHEPCGYMASMVFVPRDECDDPKYADDERLFDIKIQLDARKAEIAETFGLETETVSYKEKQDFLAAGWKATEMYFSTTGRIAAKEGDLKIPEKGEFFFVPFEHLKELIYNQGRLSKIDAKGYRPEDPKEIPLIDESLVGLIWGYEALTGEKLDIKGTVERLNSEGLEIIVHKTSHGEEYKFPTSF